MDWKKLWTTLGGRKFLGFAAACIFLACGLIGEEIWLAAFGFYVGANVAQKVLLQRGDPGVAEDSELGA